jgi:hypothetical protein
MKKIKFIFCLCLIILLFLYCDTVPNYADEIRETYEEAKRDKFAGIVIEGKMWSAVSEKPIPGNAESVDYCEYLTESGHYDWHLPTVDELRTLLRNCPNNETGGACDRTDECLSDAGCESNAETCFCCDETESREGIFSKLEDNVILWSSLPLLTESYTNTWSVDFRQGCIVSHGPGMHGAYGIYVRCVRDAE